jgi:hypothetical protein
VIGTDCRRLLVLHVSNDDQEHEQGGGDDYPIVELHQFWHVGSKNSIYRSGRSPDWLKMKNANAPAVKREAEQDGRGRGVNDLSAGAPIILATVISVVYWVGR